MSAFIDGHRDRFGVEPTCRTLGVSASAYYQRAQGVASTRSRQDERLLAVIRETHKASYEAYGYRRTWKALRRAGESAPRCQLSRLMREHGIQGAKRRGKPWRTAKPDPTAARARDLVKRGFTASAPNRLRAMDRSRRSLRGPQRGLQRADCRRPASQSGQGCRRRPKTAPSPNRR